MIIALACEDSTTILFNLQTFNYIRIIGHTSFITDVKIISLADIAE